MCVCVCTVNLNRLMQCPPSATKKHSGKTSYLHIQRYRPFPTNPPTKEESAGEKALKKKKEGKKTEGEERAEIGLCL